ncbi:MAG: hypothetical protein IPO63_07835 [Bacteroidetes bacterium]|nr:hypothetical protein [Bacteroidota bacterium]
MKKPILKSLFLLIIAVIFSGCFAIHSGTVYNSASLSSANFSYVNMNVEGEASTRYVIGFGGLEKFTLVSIAKKNMMANHPLQKNQAFVNQTLNFKTSIYFGIIITTKCVVTGVVEFR